MIRPAAWAFTFLVKVMPRNKLASAQCSLIELHRFLGQSGLVWRR
jgi:hypothetical protein